MAAAWRLKVVLLVIVEMISDQMRKIYPVYIPNYSSIIIKLLITQVLLPWLKVLNRLFRQEGTCVAAENSQDPSSSHMAIHL